LKLPLVIFVTRLLSFRFRMGSSMLRFIRPREPRGQEIKNH
jgi:hypothetical protein